MSNLSPTQFWFHTSQSEKMPNRKRATSGATGGGLHLGTREAGRHERFDTALEYETVAGRTVYPRAGRPFVHAFKVREGQQFARSADLGVSWPYKGPDRPTLYRNDVEDRGSDSLWAKPSEHLDYLGVRRNFDTHVTDLPESTVYAQASGEIAEQLKLPGTGGGGTRTWWRREEDE